MSETIEARVRRVIRESPERAWGLDAVADLAFIDVAIERGVLAIRSATGRIDLAPDRQPATAGPGVVVIRESPERAWGLDAVADLAFIELAGAGRP